MNLLLIYLLILKATVTSFSGMTSLAIIREEFVLNHHLLTDAELSTAIAAGRLTPGPNGNYLVGIGYFLAGYPGAAAGWLALITPAFLSIGLLRWLGPRSSHPAFAAAIDSVLMAAAGLSLGNALPIALDAITDWRGALLALVSGAVLLRTRIDSFWVVLGAAGVALLYSGSS